MWLWDNYYDIALLTISFSPGKNKLDFIIIPVTVYCDNLYYFTTIWDEEI